MSEDSYLLEPKEKKQRTPYEWFTLFLRIVFFISALILVVLTVLANMGGSGETWHEGVKGFISEVAGGRPVKLEKLNGITFFPTVSVDIEDAGVYTDEDSDIPLISIGRLRLGMPFWNVATRSPLITDFYIEDIAAIKGVFIPADFKVKKLFIDHDQESAKATLRVNGKIGLQAWHFEAGLEVRKTITGKTTYILSPEAPFAFDLADIHLKGIYNHASSKHMKFEDIELRAGQKTMTGDIAVSSLSGKMIKLTGTLNINDGRSIITPDLVIDNSHKNGMPRHISGEITSDKLVMEDIAGKDSVWTILARFYELLGYAGEPNQESAAGFFSGSNLDLHVFLQNVETGNVPYEALSFDVLQKEGRLRIGKVTGKDDKALMPVVMLLNNPESEELTFIMQEGEFSPDFLGHWLGTLPPELITPPSTQLRCGIGKLHKEEGRWMVAASSDFSFSDNDALGNIELPKEQYDFVKASLQESGTGSPCEAYISLEKPEE